MNKKILLSVELSVTQSVYDFWVPGDMTLHDATELISGLLQARQGDRFSVSKSTALMAKGSGDLFDHDKTLEALGLVNGTQMVLV